MEPKSVDDEDDWETKFDTGHLALPSQETPSSNNVALPSAPTRTTDGTKFESFDDILSLPATQKKMTSRPETTTVVARRFLAHALQKPELIRRKEDEEFAQRRAKKKQERFDRKKAFDDVWENGHDA